MAGVAASIYAHAFPAMADDDSKKGLTPDPEPTITQPGVMHLVDLRTPQSRRTRVLSAFLFSCVNAVKAMGEDIVAPDRLARLERDIVAAIGQRATGRTLTVRRYQILINGSATIESDVMQSAVIPTTPGHAIVRVGPYRPPTNIHPKCLRERMEGGWFDPADLTNDVSPMTVEIEFSIDDHAYSATAAYSPPGDLYSRANYSPHHLNPIAEYCAQQVMARAHSRALANVMSDFPA